MIIDMHTHLSDLRVYPDYWIQNIKENMALQFQKQMGYSVQDSFVQMYIKSMLSDYDCKRKIKAMDECGVKKCVVLQADFGYGKKAEYSIEEITEIHYEAIKRYADRFIMFSGIDPRRGEAGVKLFRKSIEQYHFSGFKVYPPCGFEIDDERLFPYYEICDNYRLPVLIHIGESWKSMKTVFNYPESILRAADRFSNIPFILGHAALLFYEDSFHVAANRENVYLEVSGYQKIIDKEEILFERMQREMCEIPDKILFGSDWPMYHTLLEDIAYFDKMDFLTQEQKDKFFFKNAQRVLDIQNNL